MNQSSIQLYTQTVLSVIWKQISQTLKESIHDFQASSNKQYIPALLQAYICVHNYGLNTRGSFAKNEAN